MLVTHAVLYCCILLGIKLLLLLVMDSIQLGSVIKSHKNGLTAAKLAVGVDAQSVITEPTWLRFVPMEGSHMGYSQEHVGTVYHLVYLRTGKCGHHYCDVTMGTIVSQITSLTIVYSTFIQAQIEEKIKAPRHWPLCREFTGDWWIPCTNGQ